MKRYFVLFAIGFLTYSVYAEEHNIEAEDIDFSSLASEDIINNVDSATHVGFDMMKAQSVAPDAVTWKGGVTEKRWFHATILPISLTALGFLAMPVDNSFKEALCTGKRMHVDDYLQYAPIATHVGLVLAGVKGSSKNRWQALTADVFAGGIMFGTTQGLKHLVGRERPEGGGKGESFPSGHTAMAFMGATALAHEYGSKSIWYTIGGYTVATTTGVMRIMNNKHYASDVLIGAAIGVLSTELGYWLSDLIFKDKKLFKGCKHNQIKYLER